METICLCTLPNERKGSTPQPRTVGSCGSVPHTSDPKIWQIQDCAWELCPTSSRMLKLTVFCSVIFMKARLAPRVFMHDGPHVTASVFVVWGEFNMLGTSAREPSLSELLHEHEQLFLSFSACSPLSALSFHLQLNCFISRGANSDSRLQITISVSAIPYSTSSLISSRSGSLSKWAQIRANFEVIAQQLIAEGTGKKVPGFAMMIADNTKVSSKNNWTIPHYCPHWRCLITFGRDYRTGNISSSRLVQRSKSHND